MWFWEKRGTLSAVFPNNEDDDLVATFGYWVVLVFVAIQCAGIPFPGGAVLLAAAIYTGTTHQLAVAPIILAAAAGAILGNLLGYLLGSRGGYRLLVRF